LRTFYHVDSVKKTFGRHLPPGAVDHIVRYNFGVDFYGVLGWKILQKKVFPLYPLARYWYHEIDHFDHMNGPETILDTYRMHVDWIMETLDDGKYPPGGAEKIFRTLGRSSHAIVDIFSHSNLVDLLYDYYRSVPAAETVSESGMEVPEFVEKHAPLLEELAGSPEHAEFREKFLPRLFTFISIPDEGPGSHEESNLDAPDAPGSTREEYPLAFAAAIALGDRQLSSVVEKYFELLKNDNPRKLDMLLSIGADAEAGKPGPAERRAKWWSDLFAVWD